MAEVGSESGGQSSRRAFVQAGLGIGVGSLAALSAIDSVVAAQGNPSPEPLIKSGDVVLFQGDSITDASRQQAATGPNDQAGLGRGYVWFAASQMLVDGEADGLKIFNRGISGQKVFELAKRWQEDCLDLKPNVLSILIGVNDFWHKEKFNYKGTVEKYESDYRALLARTKEALPDVKLVVCEPFLLRVGLVEEDWIPKFADYQAAARRVAEEAKAVFVPFQSMFDRALKLAPPVTWAADGVHPTPSGAALMAHSWMKAVGV